MSQSRSTSQFIILVAVTLVLIGIAKMIGGNVPQTNPNPTLSGENSTATENQTTQAVITTDKGDIAIELYPADAPKTVENFVTLAKKNYYNGIIFHRVMRDFMIQTGDPTGTGSGGDSAFGGEFADEINTHKIEIGTVAMANKGPNTNGSQFFIVTEESQPHLDGKHTVFGKVTAGMEVVRTIAAVPVDVTTSKPLSDVKIQSIAIK